MLYPYNFILFNLFNRSIKSLPLCIFADEVFLLGIFRKKNTLLYKRIWKKSDTINSGKNVCKMFNNKIFRLWIYNHRDWDTEKSLLNLHILSVSKEITDAQNVCKKQHTFLQTSVKRNFVEISPTVGKFIPSKFLAYIQMLCVKSSYFFSECLCPRTNTLSQKQLIYLNISYFPLDYSKESNFQELDQELWYFPLSMLSNIDLCNKIKDNRPSGST